MLSMVFNCMIVQVNCIGKLGVIVHFVGFSSFLTELLVSYNLWSLFSGLCKCINFFCVNSAVFEGAGDHERICLFKEIAGYMSFKMAFYLEQIGRIL